MAVASQQSSPGAGKVQYGRFLAPDKQVRPCEVRNLRRDGASLGLCETMAKDTPIVLYIHGVGRREARVTAVYERGMDVCFIPSKSGLRRAVDDSATSDNAAVERRHGDRINPGNGYQPILLPHGETQDCKIVDISPSGALVSLESMLPIGAIVELAGLAGRVLDRREDGTVIKFEDKVDPVKLAELIR